MITCVNDGVKKKSPAGEPVGLVGEGRGAPADYWKSALSVTVATRGAPR